MGLSNTPRHDRPPISSKGIRLRDQYQSRGAGQTWGFLVSRESDPGEPMSSSPTAVNFSCLHFSLRTFDVKVFIQSNMIHLANAVFSAEFARCYGDKGLVSIAVNPGNIGTNLSKDAFGLAYTYLGTASGLLTSGECLDSCGQALRTPEGAALNGKPEVTNWSQRATLAPTSFQSSAQSLLVIGMSLLHEAPPPSYDPSEGLAAAADSELPIYSGCILPSRCTTSTAQPAAPKEFSYEIKDYSAKPWATLTLLGHPILSSTTPTFIDRSEITGSLKLNLRSPDPIKSITIFVRGYLLIFEDPHKHSKFFRLQKLVWTSSMGDPRAPGTSTAGSLKTWTEKLKGNYELSFSINIPEFAESPNGEERFRLPHTFTDRASRGSIEYYLELRISRGKLRSDDRIMTPFGLFILRPPSPPSQLQQLAYRSNIRIPGPHSDPDGWHALEPVQVEGKLFGERTVNAKCTVFLAKPLCYTRSTSIPCAMTIETDDSQVADVLASIKSAALYLQRCVRCTFGYSSTNVSPCGQAVWWPAPDAAMAHLGNATQRHIMGEIHLRRDLHPSTAIKQFQVEARTVILDAYAVAVFPPTAVAFKPHSTGPFITQTVEIVTGHAEGVRARTATIPPAKESSDPFVERYYESVAGPKPRRPLRGP
ncbi:hypothetical protein DFH08DRAFT_1087431 [Mycena albidolilacea]|uniref:Arrestin-like N-terminal domain-containing protein n=1 Tax=Mycena albidolilacea TaxID=1033008 RepID=A0AAD7EDW0_9AGAR|nr:hypothetical protein DFH08DRAFT_1087431 [Mycena albidolilacea]